MKTKLIQTDLYLILIDEEAEIKAVTTLLEEDEGLERFTNRNFYKPIIAYRKLTKEAKELDLPLLPNPFDDVNIEKLAGDYYDKTNWTESWSFYLKGFEDGYKAAQSNKQYSLEDMKKAIKMAQIFNVEAQYDEYDVIHENLKHIYSEEQIIQSLSSSQQLPKEFIPEYEECECNLELYPDQEELCSDKRCRNIKTITNSEGKQELKGTYKW